MFEATLKALQDLVADSEDFREAQALWESIYHTMKAKEALDRAEAIWEARDGVLISEISV